MMWLGMGGIILFILGLGGLTWLWGAHSIRVTAEQEKAERRQQKELDAYRRATR